MENTKACKVENYVLSGIRITMYTILPLLAFCAWVIGMPLLIYGGMITSVDSANGFFQTFLIFSFPMLLFFAIIPVAIKLRRKDVTLDDLGLIFHFNKKSVIPLLINGTIACFVIFKLFLAFGDAATALPVIIQLTAIGISEEILCRSVIFNEADKAFKNRIVTIILSSLIFAFMFHSGDSDAANLLVRVPLGIMFALMRHFTGNVYSSIGMHIWYNALMCL